VEGQIKDGGTLTNNLGLNIRAFGNMNEAYSISLKKLQLFALKKIGREWRYR